MATPQIDVHGREKPLLRGRVHALAFFVAIPAAIVLIGAADGTSALVGAAVYGVSLMILFGASSAYHRLGRDEASQRWLRRLDHSSIYILIAGSYTPLCLLSLSGWWGTALLIGVWTAAAAGVFLKLTRFESSHTVGFVLYLVMGWAVVAAGPALVSDLSGETLALLAAGGVVYSAGAAVLGTRTPNPFPRVFGYHEVWHLMVVIAAVLHYMAIYGVVTEAA